MILTLIRIIMYFCFINQSNIRVCHDKKGPKTQRKTHRTIFNSSFRHFRVLSSFRAPFWALAQRENLGRHQCRCPPNDHQSLGVVFKTAAVWFPDAKCRSKTPEGFPARILARASSRAAWNSARWRANFTRGFGSEHHLTVWFGASFQFVQDIFMTVIMLWWNLETLQNKSVSWDNVYVYIYIYI